MQNIYKITLHGFATMLREDHSLLSKIESGKRVPSDRLLKKLISTTGYPLSVLVKGNFEEAQTQVLQPLSSSFMVKHSNTSKTMVVKTLQELTLEQRKYLREKFSVEQKEINDDIAEAKGRLAGRIERSSLSGDKLTELEDAFGKSQRILDTLKASKAAADIIADQEEMVNDAQTKLAEQRRKSGVLSDEEAFLEQVEIDELELRLKYREDKIKEIDALG